MAFKQEMGNLVGDTKPFEALVAETRRVHDPKIIAVTQEHAGHAVRSAGLRLDDDVKHRTMAPKIMSEVVSVFLIKTVVDHGVQKRHRSITLLIQGLGG